MSKQQQPVAWMDKREGIPSIFSPVKHCESDIPLVTADYAESLRQQRDELLADMAKIAFMPYPGAPDIEMRRIARAAIAKAKEQP